MNDQSDLLPIKQIPIIEVAIRLGIKVHGTKAMCFTGHDKASASLSFLKSRNTWRCFGACGGHGDSITLVMNKEGLDFKGALDWFAQNFGVPRQHRHLSRPRFQRLKKKVFPIMPLAEEQKLEPDAELFEWLIENCAKVSSQTGLDYLSSHGISQEVAVRFNIREMSDSTRALREMVKKWGSQRVSRSGLVLRSSSLSQRLIWSKHALLFPFYEQGMVTYIQARMFGGTIKFLNPSGLPKPMFNVDRLQSLKPGELIHLCEGATDTLALESNGLAAVGILGAASFRPDWVDRFLKFKIVVLGDGDAAGTKFANDVSNYFLKRAKVVTCARLPIGQDVSDVLAQTRRRQ